MLIKILENTSGFLAFQVDIAFGQFQKILFAFAKRRQFQSEDIDAVQQILTERAIFYCGLHVFIGSSDDPDIDRDHLASAKTHDFPFLNDSQKSCLKIDSHISDFIEKQSAIMGKLKQAGFSAFYGSGESSFHISEQLTFQQRFWKSSAVDGYKRTVSAAAGIVDTLSKQFFSGAGFSMNKYIRFCMGIFAGGLNSFFHNSTVADDVFKMIFCTKPFTMKLLSDASFIFLDVFNITESDNKTIRLIVFFGKPHTVYHILSPSRSNQSRENILGFTGEREFREKMSQWFSNHPVWCMMAAPVILIQPFCGKAVNGENISRNISRHDSFKRVVHDCLQIFSLFFFASGKAHGSNCFFHRLIDAFFSGLQQNIGNIPSAGNLT